MVLPGDTELKPESTPCPGRKTPNHHRIRGGEPFLSIDPDRIPSKLWPLLKPVSVLRNLHGSLVRRFPLNASPPLAAIKDTKK